MWCVTDILVIFHFRLFFIYLLYGVRQTDGQMDAQKKQHTEVGAPPKNDES